MLVKLRQLVKISRLSTYGVALIVGIYPDKMKDIIDGRIAEIPEHTIKSLELYIKENINHNGDQQP